MSYPNPFSGRSGGSAAAVTARLRPAGNKGALLGHSFNARGVHVISTSPREVAQATGRGPGPFLAMTQRLRFPESCKFAVSGSTIEQIYTTALTAATNTTLAGGTQLSNALACPADFFDLNTGVNDVVAGYSFARMIVGTGNDGKGLRYVIDGLVATGKPVILHAPAPRGTSVNTAVRYTAAQLATLMQFREWILRVAPTLWPGQVLVVDDWAALSDRAGTPGDIKAGYIESDASHLNSAGAFQVAKAMGTALQSLGLPPIPVDIHQPGDTYDATNNPRGNLYANGELTGATAVSGTAGGATYSGVRPTGHGFVANTALQGGASVSLAGSQVTNTATGDWYQLAFSGTTAAAGAPIASFQLNNFPLASMAAGEVLAGFGEFEIAAGTVGLCAASLRYTRTWSGGTDTVRLGYADAATFGGTLDSIVASAALAGQWNGLDILAQPWRGDETAFVLYVDLIFAPSATISGSVRFRNLAVRKVT